ncbi:fumarylacetoacetate hydrolase family protein [Halarchaeum acidiphilum MH1-52-1]|uniref:Fumarylacetoacetate hydrolase family protein n=1 Tax=Halarchaeum acidiphilum MH1-52-1 TaxID=1261545 RepID=U2YGD0_9EURY|nr:fumarylacetoacetate hydrolase family protein [Halarchaeum acidiphilum]GAD53301.1 fumarylacetoacetate hydrolase family protein [Halarchaeum acidiphilum MH1-52-1]
MRYQQIARGAERHLVAETTDQHYDLTAAKPELESFRDLARAASVTDETIDEIARGALDDASELDAETVADERLLPVAPEEVWAAGVTYEISEQARQEESDTPDMYVDVYDAERPEVFFKATPSRTVGPDEDVGVRADSQWNVPEPELGIVLYRGDIVGYTVGNDVSSRDIEGENPLYLPQAKVYDRCCSLGPCVASTDDIPDPHDLSMSMSITRDGEEVYTGETSTIQMVRTCEELADYYTRHNAVPELAVLLTGTSIVPSDDFDLAAGDEVAIDIEGIGTLTNGVRTV